MGGQIQEEPSPQATSAPRSNVANGKNAHCVDANRLIGPPVRLPTLWQLMWPPVTKTLTIKLQRLRIKLKAPLLSPPHFREGPFDFEAQMFESFGRLRLSVSMSTGRGKGKRVSRAADTRRDRQPRSVFRMVKFLLAGATGTYARKRLGMNVRVVQDANINQDKES